MRQRQRLGWRAVRDGGFENESNIPHFVAYAEKMFLQFRDRVSLWVTINEPFFYSFNGASSGASADTPRRARDQS